MYVCRYKSGNQECDSCGRCGKTPSYFCPVCGEEVYETIFVTNDGEVLGCENCAQIKEPCDMIQEEEDPRADEAYEDWRDSRFEVKHK